MLSWLYFFRFMVGSKRNIIIPCLALSVVFHTMLFTVAFVMIKNKKEISHIEVFLFSENKVSTNIDVPLKKAEKNVRNFLPFSSAQESEKLIQYQRENSDKRANISEVMHSHEFQIGNDRITKNLVPSSEGGEGIIDSTFGSINGPKFLQRETPIYPPLARRLGKEGKVVLKLTINEKGELVDIEIVESAPYGFTESAIEAVKKSKFLPAMKDGNPITSRAILPIKFVLKN